MEIEAIRLRGFRNYRELDAAFVPGVNLILGDNAQGKTNLLEAITYLSTGRAFRTRKEQELILFGSDFADLEADVLSKNRDKTIRAVLFPGRKPRQLYLNGVKQKNFTTLEGELTTVLFCPEDLSILKAGPRSGGGFWTLPSASCAPATAAPCRSISGCWITRAAFSRTGGSGQNIWTSCRTSICAWRSSARC